MRKTILVLLAVLAPAPERPQVIIPPRQAVGTIEFLDASGVDRWRVRLSGDTVNIRFTGPGCSFLDAVYKGLITPLYDDMTFRAANGRQCQIAAIER